MDSDQEDSQSNRIIVPEEQKEEKEQGYNIFNENKKLIKEIKSKIIKNKQKQKEKEKNKEKKEREKRPITNYIRLYNGEEIHFDESENNKYPLLLSKYISDGLIRNIICRIPRNIHKRICYLKKFLIPETEINNPLYDYYKTIQTIIFKAYYRELKLRFLFRILLQKWRINKLKSNNNLTVDPITLTEPMKPVTIYSWEVNKQFIFDAKALSNSINSNLLYYENGFAIPKDPKNVIMNKPFTYSQLISIYNQLKEKGEIQWALSTLRQYDFNLKRWELYNKAALYYNSIKNEITKLDTYDGRELFIDFVATKLEEYQLYPSDYVINAYEKGVLYYPNHFYLENLKQIVIIHYEAQFFRLNRSVYIKAAFLRAHKKQSKFIKDMINKGFI